MTIRRWLPRVARALLVLGLAAAWWLTLAPAAIGGPATYVVVSGHSMEPRLHPGDLVVARAQPRYRIGDLVVFRYGHGQVVHDLMWAGPRGWRTKGEHNSWVDPWWVAGSDIVGRPLVTLPRFGTAIRWSAGHPAGFGLVVAALAALTTIPRPRRRWRGELTGAFARSIPERPPRALTGDGTRTGIVSAASALVSLAAALLLAAHGRLRSPAGALALIGFVAAFAAAWLLLRRARDGLGLPEPERTRCALGERLRLVPELPELPRRPHAADAATLRRHADRLGVPVLHVVGTEGDEFLVVGRRRAWLLRVEAQPLIERSSPFQKSSRSLNFWSLPVAVRGRASRNSTRFGHL